MAENKYGDPQGVEQTIYNKGDYKIQLRHLPSGKNVEFKAFLTQFEDQFTSDWNMEQVFGRLDPIRNYRGTQRIITLGWDVVANDLEEAIFNLNNCSLLLSMLYPSFDDDTPDNTATTEAGTKQRVAAQQNTTEPKKQAVPVNGNANRIQGAPLFRLKFANLIQSTNATGAPSTIDDGLVGAIDGLTYSPDVDQGFFDPDPGILYPQTIRLSFGFYVTHDHALGWSNNKLRGNLASFPYPKGGE